MAEWTKVTVLKTVVAKRLSGLVSPRNRHRRPQTNLKCCGFLGARFSLIFAAKDLKSSSDLVIIGKSDSQIVVLGVGSVSRLTIMCQCKCGSEFPNKP